MSADTPRIHPTARIDGTAEVAPDAIVGPGTTVSAGVRLSAGARIGADCTVGRDVLIDDGVAIGDRVRIGEGTLIYRGASLEDDVVVGPRVVITNERRPRAITTTRDVPSDEEPLPPTVLRRGAILGAGSIVAAGVDIGTYAMTVPGAVVTTSVSGHALTAGNPGHRAGWVCCCGVGLVDAEGAPAAPSPAQYARHPELSCPSCGRTFAYVPDADRLEERSGPTN